jgi:hypothetical protein
MLVSAPISVGELVDKITILEIKLDRINDPNKLTNIALELGHLTSILKGLDLKDTEALLRSDLKEINAELWDIENFKRGCESTQDFGQPFIEAARNVYLKNDQRASLKRAINILAGSTIIEEKSY